MRKIYSHLDGGICPAYHIDDFSLSGEGFGSTAAVINAGPLEAVDSRSFQPSPLHSRRDHERVARDFAGIRQLEDAVRALSANGNRFLGRKNFDSEASCLHDSPASQIGTAESGGESEIVFDARTHSRLAAGRLPLDHNGVQALRGTVNGGRQPGRTSTYNGEVVKTCFGTRAQAHLLRDISGRALQQFCSIGEKHNWKFGGFRSQGPQQAFSLGVVSGELDVNPLVGDVISREEIAQLITSR